MKGMEVRNLTRQQEISCQYNTYFWIGIYVHKQNDREYKWVKPNERVVKFKWEKLKFR